MADARLGAVASEPHVTGNSPNHTLEGASLVARSKPPAGTGAPRRAVARSWLAVGCGLLAAISIFHYARERAMQIAAERFAQRSGLDRTHPLETAAIRLEPAGDLAIAVAVSTVLPEPGATQATVAAEHLAAARDRMLEAVAARPGWAYHRFLLGRVAWIEAARSDSGPADPVERWLVPLSSAAKSAPGADLLWTSLGHAMLSAWPRLDPATRADAGQVLARAFRDPAFVSRELLRAAQALGRERVFDLLPAASAPLTAAADALARAGEVKQAALLMPRISTAQRRERAGGLRRIEATHLAGNVDDLREMCATWVAAYPPGEFDDPVGRRQTARALELWPHFRAGTWRSDRRTELVQFFLDGREANVSGEALRRAVEALSGVPPAIAARIELLAGNEEAAAELARASEGTESLDWTPYFVQRALWELGRRHAAEARAAIEKIAPDARAECGVLLARRAAARALRDQAEAELVNASLSSLQKEFYGADSWSRTGGLSLCVDPVWAGKRLLKVSLEAETPAILAYGWNGGRSGTVLVERSGEVTVSLAGLSGRNTFSVQRLLGGAARPSGGALFPAQQAQVSSASPAGGRTLRGARDVLRFVLFLHSRCD